MRRMQGERPIPGIRPFVDTDLADARKRCQQNSARLQYPVQGLQSCIHVIHKVKGLRKDNAVKSVRRDVVRLGQDLRQWLPPGCPLQRAGYPFSRHGHRRIWHM